MTKSIANFQGAVLGGAIGDALGFLTEKKPIIETENFVKTFLETKQYSIPFRTYPKNYLLGQYSDDTQFSRILISSLIECSGFNAANYFSKLQEAFNKNELIGLGTNTNKIFRAANKKQDLSTLLNNSSNGSLMRAYPIGLFFSKEDEILQYSKEQSVITHNTDEAIFACQMLALTINHLKDNSINSLHSHWQNNNFLNFDFSFLSYSLTDAQKYIQSISPNLEWEFVSPSAKATLAAVYYVIHNHKHGSFTDAIMKAISLGGDTDSVASIVGTIIGYHHGRSAIPAYWNNFVHDEEKFDQNYLMDLSKELYNNCR